MCGIMGFIRLSGETNSTQFFQWLSDVAHRTMQRGPDAMGCISFNLNEPRKPAWEAWEGYDLRGLSDAKRTEYLFSIFENVGDADGCSMNFRGVPTTEQFNHPKLNDDEIQPFHAYGFSIAHNGLLSNDKTLRIQYDLPRLSSNDEDIDSYIFLNLAHQFSMQRALDAPFGSWALALIDHNKNRMILSRTFLGLHICMLADHNARYLVWSSEPFESVPDFDFSPYYVWEMAPYSAVTLDLIRLTTTYASAELYDIALAIQGHTHALLPRIAASQSKCVVVISGGLDSTVAATLATMAYEEVHLLHFQYGARAEKRERQAVEQIAQYLHTKFSPVCVIVENYIDLSFLKRLGGSTLTDHSLEIAAGEEGIETAHEWVPARNLVMAAMAAAYCDRHDISVISLGTNREESAVYADNSSEFHVALSKTLALCTQSRPQIIAPLEHMMKAHIYAKAIEIGAPIHLSWSCYLSGAETNEALHCGSCGPCLLRKTAAQMNGMADCISYIRA